MTWYKCGGGKPEEEKTVTAGTSVIDVMPSSGKTMKKVTVNPTPSETKTVTPSASQQTVSPSSGKLLSKVTVDGDSDLVAGNIKNGVNIFGVTGTLQEGSKVASGSIAKSKVSDDYITITHGLGKTPTKFILMADLSDSGKTGSLGAFYNVLSSNKVVYADSSYGCYAESSEFTVNSTTVKIKALTSIGEYWNTSINYYWLAIA